MVPLNLECCCRSKKPTTPEDPNISSISSDLNTTVQISTESVQPPNYDEIDPPPSYAILFPNQKQTPPLTPITDAAPTTEIINIENPSQSIQNNN